MASLAVLFVFNQKGRACRTAPLANLTSVLLAHSLVCGSIKKMVSGVNIYIKCYLIGSS